jgi:hypothetical protein
MHRRIAEVNPLGGASIKAASNFDPELLSLGRKIVERFTGNPFGDGDASRRIVDIINKNI